MRDEAAPSGTRQIAGWPAIAERFAIGSTPAWIWTVENLAERLDRSRLLTDESFEPPYWALVWSGSRHVAERILPGLEIEGRRVLDVGCGLGLVAVAATVLGATVTAIARSEVAIEFTQATLAGLGAAAAVAICADVRSLVGRSRYDLVVAAELLYERESMAELAGALLNLLDSGGELLIADAHRVKTAPFYEALSTHGAHLVADQCWALVEEGLPVRLRVTRWQAAGSLDMG